MSPREETRSATETLRSASSDSQRGPIPLPDIGSVLADRYELLELRGSGSHGVVYRAMDRVLRAEVAIKILRPERAAEASNLERFRREAVIARSIVSPNLVRIFDLIKDADWTFLAMEWVAGESLRDRLAQGALELTEAVTIATGLLRGLTQLHEAGVVHRDIKPANILLRRPFRTADDVTLSDLGLARRLSPDATRATQDKSVLGTLAYLSPEQLRGAEASRGSDLYATGLTVFQMLTGKLPGAAADDLTTVLERLRLSERERDPRLHRPKTPSWLAAWVRHSLEPEPERRYQTASEALADLLASRPPKAERQSLRRRRLLAASAFVVAAATLATGLALWVGRPRFSHLRAMSPSGPGIEAIGERGEILWSLPGVDRDLSQRAVRVRLARGAEPVLAMIPEIEGSVPKPEQFLDLQFREPRNGRIIRRARFDYRDGLAATFGNIQPTFFVHSLQAHDFDHDGIDEVLAVFVHAPSWASFASIYEPRLDRSRPILAAGGHHYFAGTRDLDGDGREEVLFTGISSLLGRYLTLVAVPVDPWIGERPSDPSPPYSVTPDLRPSQVEDGLPPNLPWTTLVDAPDTASLKRGAEALDVDTRRRLIRLNFLDGSQRTYSPEGLSLDRPSAVEPKQRLALRRLAFRAFRDAYRFLSDDDPSSAAESAASGIAPANEAGEPRLAEALVRFQARALLRSGDLRQGLPLIERLYATSDRASDIAFDAAQALEAIGDMQRAVTWYRKGLGRGAVDTTKNKEYFVLGAVRGLVALQRHDEAWAEVDRFARLYPETASDYRANVPRAWIRMKRGDPPETWSTPLDLPPWAAEESQAMADEVRAATPRRSSGP